MKYFPIITLSMVTLAAPAGFALDASTGEGIAQLCTETSNMPEKICDCVGETAEEQLSSQGRQLFAAIIIGDADMANALRKNVATDEVIAAGMFMATVPGQCAN
ncbi:MAG: hypothetical protein GY945_02295 [Rhodobacteraceae bacterium]|nr:hypothetical protein [Paracoccaceae bacterium]